MSIDDEEDIDFEDDDDFDFDDDDEDDDEDDICPECGELHEDCECGDFCSECGEPYEDCVCDDENCVRGPDESMDGDHETGLRDAGLGTDEDYGCFGSGLKD